MLFGVIPQVAHRVRQVAEQPSVVAVVVRVGVESPRPQVGAHRHAGLERQHGQLRLPPQRAVVRGVRAGVLFGLGERVGRRQRVRVGAQALGGERRAVGPQVPRLGRQQLRRGGQTLRPPERERLHRRPIGVVEERRVHPRGGGGGGDVAQQAGVAEAGGANHVGGLAVAAEAQIRHRHGAAVAAGEQGGERWIALRIAPAPVVYHAHGVRVGLRVHAVDDQHAAVVAREERLVVGERRVGEVAGLPHLALRGPVVDGRLARHVRLRVAETGGVPTTVRLRADEELAAVVGGVRQRQAEARRGCGAGPENAFQQGASSHRALTGAGSGSPS